MKVQIHVFRYLDRTVEGLIAAILLSMVAVGGVQVISRYGLNASLSWSEEFQRFAHIWLVFLAIPVGYNRGSHIGMTVLLKKMPRRLRTLSECLADLLWMILGIAMVVYTWDLFAVARNQTSPGLGLRMDWVYTGILLSGFYLAILALRKFLSRAGLWGGEEEGGAKC